VDHGIHPQFTGSHTPMNASRAAKVKVTEQDLFQAQIRLLDWLRQVVMSLEVVA
jgi:hypothetical protein